MKRNSLILTFILACGSLAASAQTQTTTYAFQEINYPGDTFTQLLGINNNGVIAGYHGATVNSGFVLTLPNQFVTENYPGSAQTQVIGIDSEGYTAGFYIDGANTNHGFVDIRNNFTTVDYPGTTFNQLLGINDKMVAVGYYADSNNNDHAYEFQAGVFTLIQTPGASSQAVGIDHAGDVVGFYDTHGFYLPVNGTLVTLDFPEAQSTGAFGINNLNQIVGSYTDAKGNMHGFLYDIKSKNFQSVNDPHGVDSTLVNGINDQGKIVGFWNDSSANSHGFLGKIVRCE